MGRKRKHFFFDDVPRDSSGFPFGEDELAIEVIHLRRTLADMESYANSHADKANFFYKTNVTLDMEKAELETEIEDLRSHNEALRERVSTFEHVLVHFWRANW